MTYKGQPIVNIPPLRRPQSPTYPHPEERAALKSLLDKLPSLPSKRDTPITNVTIDLSKEDTDCNEPCYTPSSPNYHDWRIRELEAHNKRLIENVEHLEEERDTAQEMFESLSSDVADEARSTEGQRRRHLKKIYEQQTAIAMLKATHEANRLALERRNDADVEELNYNRQLVDEQRIKITDLERQLKERSDRLARIEIEYQAEIRGMDDDFAERILSDSDAAKMTAAELYAELKRRDATIDRLKGTIKSFKQPRRADRLKAKQPSFK